MAGGPKLVRRPNSGLLWAAAGAAGAGRRKRSRRTASGGGGGVDRVEDGAGRRRQLS